MKWSRSRQILPQWSVSVSTYESTDIKLIRNSQNNSNILVLQTTQNLTNTMTAIQYFLNRCISRQTDLNSKWVTWLGALRPLNHYGHIRSKTLTWMAVNTHMVNNNNNNKYNNNNNTPTNHLNKAILRIEKFLCTIGACAPFTPTNHLNEAILRIEKCLSTILRGLCPFHPN